jgi:hypothetical protein
MVGRFNRFTHLVVDLNEFAGHLGAPEYLLPKGPQ